MKRLVYLGKKKGKSTKKGGLRSFGIKDGELGHRKKKNRVISKRGGRRSKSGDRTMKTTKAKREKKKKGSGPAGSRKKGGLY